MRKYLLTILTVFLFSFSFLSSNVSDVSAGARCCDPKPGTGQCGDASDQGCGPCYEGRDVKNPAYCHPWTDQPCSPSDPSCLVCPSGKVVNSCGSGSNNNQAYCSLNFLEAASQPIQITVGETRSLPLQFGWSGAYNNDQYSSDCVSWPPIGIDSVRSVDAQVASVSPFNNARYCGAVGRSPRVVYPVITGINPGTTVISTTGLIQGPDGYAECTSGILVQVVADGEANLQISKTVDNDTPSVGETITYTVTLTNSGPDSATDTVVTESVPDGTEYVSHSASAGTYENQNGTWTIGELLSGQTVTLDLTVRVLTDEIIVNTAAADSSVPDPDETDNEITITIDPEDNLTIDIEKEYYHLEPGTTWYHPAILGDGFVFMVTIKNNNSVDVSNVIVNDSIPAGLSYANHTDNPNDPYDSTTHVLPVSVLYENWGPGNYDADTGVWNVGTLAAGEEKRLAILVMTEEPGFITNTACARVQSGPESCASATIEVVWGHTPDIGISKSVIIGGVERRGQTTASIGDEITYKITATNTGNAPAVNVVVNDLVDTNFMEITSVNRSYTYPFVREYNNRGVHHGGEYNQATGDWEIGVIPSNYAATLEITGRILSATTNTNTATLTGVVRPDLNPDNNQDSVTVDLDPANDVGAVSINTVQCINCNYHVYAFWGDLIESFRGGVRYESIFSNYPTRAITSASDKGEVLGERTACTLEQTSVTDLPGDGYQQDPNNGPECDNPVENGLLVSSIDRSGSISGNGYSTINIINTTSNCRYKVGAASYKSNWSEPQFSYPTSNEIENYNLVDSYTLDIEPLTRAQLSVKTPFNQAGDMCYSSANNNQDAESNKVESCRSGYWSSNVSAWDQTSFATTDLVSSIYTLPTEFVDLNSDNLLQTINYARNEATETGMAKRLIREATVALLNSETQNYSFSANEIIDIVNTSLSRMSVDYGESAESWQQVFETMNELNNCVL